MNIKDTLIHRMLAVPYVLHTTIRESSAPKAPTLLFIHGIGNSGEAWHDVIEKLPHTYRVVTIDLLGFGKSPRPSWGRYDAKRQARAVLATYFRYRLRGRIVVIGHSLGALVAVEIAKMYPLLVKALILCSPPFYKVANERRLLPTTDTMLREIYKLAQKRPESVIRIGQLAVQLGVVNKKFSLRDTDVPVYMNALESSIINQTSLEDAQNIHVRTRILYGRLDPVVIAKNLKALAKKNKNITVKAINASHEIHTRAYIAAVVQSIQETTDEHGLKAVSK